MSGGRSFCCIILVQQTSLIPKGSGFSHDLRHLGVTLIAATLRHPLIVGLRVEVPDESLHLLVSGAGSGPVQLRRKIVYKKGFV